MINAVIIRRPAREKRRVQQREQSRPERLGEHPPCDGGAGMLTVLDRALVDQGVGGVEGDADLAQRAHLEAETHQVAPHAEGGQPQNVVGRLMFAVEKRQTDQQLPSPLR